MLCSRQEDKGEVWHHNSLLGRSLFTLMFGIRLRLHYLEAIDNLFVDDLFRRCLIYPMRHKFEVLNLFMKWKELIEKQTGSKIKVL